VNDAPHPQDASDFGFSTIWKDELIISSTKSTFAPLTISRETPSTTTLAPSLAKSYQWHARIHLEMHGIPFKNMIVTIQAVGQFELVFEARASSTIYPQPQEAFRFYLGNPLRIRPRQISVPIKWISHQNQFGTYQTLCYTEKSVVFGSYAPLHISE
jgi:hypothetical protein